MKEKFLKISQKWVSEMHPFVQMSERSFYNAKINNESKTGMGVLFEHRNR